MGKEVSLGGGGGGLVKITLQGGVPGQHMPPHGAPLRGRYFQDFVRVFTEGRKEGKRGESTLLGWCGHRASLGKEGGR